MLGFAFSSLNCFTSKIKHIVMSLIYWDRQSELFFLVSQNQKTLNIVEQSIIKSLISFWTVSKVSAFYCVNFFSWFLCDICGSFLFPPWIWFRITPRSRTMTLVDSIAILEIIQSIQVLRGKKSIKILKWCFATLPFWLLHIVINTLFFVIQRRHLDWISAQRKSFRILSLSFLLTYGVHWISRAKLNLA